MACERIVLQMPVFHWPPESIWTLEVRASSNGLKGSSLNTYDSGTRTQEGALKSSILRRGIDV